MTAVRAIVTASLVGLVSAHDTDHDTLETLAGLVPELDSGVTCQSFFREHGSCGATVRSSGRVGS